MKRTSISKGGQISIPAEVRRRWATDSVVVEDLGDRIIVRPMPDDPVAAARGSLPARRSSTASKARAQIRREEGRSEARKFRR